ncbi:GNAT family N-acetyltransferase [Thalassotalea maritima]|uniref:GNAT family N-acetyltransferase n=1 Tax=Thalassotalea maritima TaxID=3242416 RepID=UPI0035291BB9
MINKLDNSNNEIAEQIFNVFQSSYNVEAQLIGTLEFPPLSRCSKDIECSLTLFYGFIVNGYLAGVIEIAIRDNQLEIDSLTVAPHYFRQGIADKLLNYVLGTFEFTRAIVETAVVNEPAIRLYKKHGFVEFKRWIPAHGIEKLALAVENAI